MTTRCQPSIYKTIRPTFLLSASSLPLRAAPVPRHRVPGDQHRVVPMDKLHRRRQRLARDFHRRAVLFPGPRVCPAVHHQGVKLFQGAVVREYDAASVVVHLSALKLALDAAEGRGADVEEIVSHEAYPELAPTRRPLVLQLTHSDGLGAEDGRQRSRGEAC